jgi:hypothetical protein
MSGPSGWRCIYADLSPLRYFTLTDLRIRYESASGSEMGAVTAYFDNIRVERDLGPGQDESDEVLNSAFESDVDGNGTPDFWTSVAGSAETGNVLRSDLFACDGQYSMVVQNEYCQPGEGGQQVVFANGDVGTYEYQFEHMATEATAFQFRVVDALSSAVIVNREVNSSTSWHYAWGTFNNPACGFAPRRLRVQFLPNDCQAPVWIDALHISQAQAGGDPEEGNPVAEREGMVRLNVSPNPGSCRDLFNVRFRLAQPSDVSMETFDLAGRMIGSTSSSFLKAGEHMASWWPTSAVPPIAAGRYWLRLRVNGELVPGSTSVTVVK